MWTHLKERLPEALAGTLTPTPGVGTHAAVLMGLSDFDSGPHLWFIRRPEHMRRHGGQVAFPGGKYDERDGSLLETALREAEEEIGVRRDQVTVLGPLEEIVIGFSGVIVTPYVGWIAPGFKPAPSKDEVARVFTIRLDEAISALDSIHPLVGVDLDGERLWGASAWMVKRLGAAVRRAEVAARARGRSSRDQ